MGRAARIPRHFRISHPRFPHGRCSYNVNQILILEYSLTLVKQCMLLLILSSGLFGVPYKCKRRRSMVSKGGWIEGERDQPKQRKWQRIHRARGGDTGFARARRDVAYPLPPSRAYQPEAGRRRRPWRKGRHCKTSVSSLGCVEKDWHDTVTRERRIRLVPVCYVTLGWFTGGLMSRPSANPSYMFDNQYPSALCQ